MNEPNVKEIEKDLDENVGPVLRSHKKKGENVMVGTSGSGIEDGHPAKQDVFQGLVVSKWNVLFAYNVVKMIVPHDCPLLSWKRKPLSLKLHHW